MSYLGYDHAGRIEHTAIRRNQGILTLTGTA